MEKFVEIIVKELVEQKDAVKVTENLKDGNFYILKISVADEDMGKVIGKNGKIANAIRSLVKSASANTNKRYYVQIGEKEGE